MEKRISYTQFQAVKSVAKAIDPILKRKESLKKQIAKLEDEMKVCDEQVAAFESGIIQNIGFHVNELVKKQIDPDKKVAKWVPTDNVKYDEVKKQYIIIVEEDIKVPSPSESIYGNDFDKDKTEINPVESSII